MNVINIDELKEQILLMLKEYSENIKQAIIKYQGNDDFVNHCNSNLEQCINDIENINLKMELLLSLIINNPIINKIIPDKLKNIYIHPFSYDNSTYPHIYLLKYDFSGLSVKDENDNVICDIHFSDQHSESFINHYWNLNPSSILFIGLSAIKKNEIYYYDNKVMTKSKTEKITKAFRVIKHLSKQFTYYNTPIEINLLFDKNSIFEDETKIKYLNNFVEEGDFSTEKQLNSFQRYYNDNCDILEVDELNKFLKNIRTIKKYLLKKNIHFNFFIDVITNMKPRIYFNEKASANNMSNILFIEIDKNTKLQDFLSKKICYENLSKIHKTPYTFLEYLKDKTEIDTLIGLMQY